MRCVARAGRRGGGGGGSSLNDIRRTSLCKSEGIAVAESLSTEATAPGLHPGGGALKADTNEKLWKNSAEAGGSMGGGGRNAAAKNSGSAGMRVLPMEHQNLDVD